MIKQLMTLALCFFFSFNLAYADKALVNIDFELNNVAILKDNSPKTNLGAIIPYEEIIKVDDYIDEQTKLGRTINIHWHIVNYEPTQSLLSVYPNSYYLFDITWYRLRTFNEYKEKDGKWVSMSSFPTGFNFNPHSEATIYGYGDVPVFISPTICSGGICLGGGGEHQGEFEEIVEKEIVKEDYRIKIIKYPITKSVYIILNDTNLINKKLELEGKLIIGDSAIATIIDSSYFPFDRYSFDFIYTSYYSSDVNLNMRDIEDLDLSTSREMKFSSNKNQKIPTSIILKREKVFRNILWSIISALIPLILVLLEKKFHISWWIRLLTYVIAFISIYVALPTPLNVPQHNLLSVLTWSVYAFVILFIEINSRRYLRLKKL